MKASIGRHVLVGRLHELEYIKMSVNIDPASAWSQDTWSQNSLTQIEANQVQLILL